MANHKSALKRARQNEIRRMRNRTVKTRTRSVVKSTLQAAGNNDKDAALKELQAAQSVIDKAAKKGCDGVDPDNVDGYANDTGFPLKPQDQIAYNIWTAKAAHLRGLAVGLKNDLDQIQELLPHYEWALNEQCFQYNECGLLMPFIQAGKPVFGIEYQGKPSEFCPQARYE